jgi:ethanolamine utilization protein EutA
VIAPALDLGGDISPVAVAKAIELALSRAPVEDDRPIALSIHWRGDPLHSRLHKLASGIALAFAAPVSRLAPRASRLPPLVLMIDGDVGRTLGYILEHELAIGRHVVSIDGIQLKEFDFVDIGEVIRPADVVPVVIKSLLFSGAPTAAARDEATAYKPITKTRRAAS